MASLSDQLRFEEEYGDTIPVSRSVLTFSSLEAGRVLSWSQEKITLSAAVFALMAGHDNACYSDANH